MAVRERLKALMPGLDPSNNLRLAADPIMLAREATAAMYQTMGGHMAIVPRLDIGFSARAATQQTMTNPLLLGPLFRVSRRMGSLPIKVWEFTTKDGRRERDEAMDHPGYKLLRRPNPDLTRAQMISGTVLGQFVFNRIGWLKERRDRFGPSDPSNPVVALWPIPGPVLWVLRGERRIVAGYELRLPGREPQTLNVNDVIVYDLGVDPLNFADSVNPLNALNDVADFGQEDIAAMRKLFRTALLQRIWINLKGADLEDEARERLRAEMENAASARGGVPIMESGATIETMGSGVDNQLLKDGLDIARATILDTLGFPKDLDDPLLFYGEVIQPIADAMEQRLEMSLFTEWPKREAFPEFQFREVLMGSPEQRAKIHQVRILSAQETPDEARAEENKPPMPGGDVLLAPLNVVVLKTMVEQAQNPPAPVVQLPSGGRVAGGTQTKAATRGGFGGREGRQAGGGSSVARLPSVAARMSEEEMPKLRAQGRDNWSGARSQIIDRRATALERRLRGAIQAESRALRELVGPLDRRPPAEAITSEVFNDRLVQTRMAETDTFVENLLVELLRSTADDAYDTANMLMSDPVDLPDRTRAVMSEQVDSMMKARARDMTEHFAERRRQEVDNLLAESKDQRDFVDGLRSRYDVIGDHFTNVIGVNETAWAFEHAAAWAWADLGYTEVGVVREANGCRTGTCDATQGQRYRTGEVPTPLHPNCECFVVPAGLEE